MLYAHLPVTSQKSYFAPNPKNREPRTKTQEQTRIHSDIRRAARSYLRHRALVLDIPGPGSMALAVRRVCAIKIQRWFLRRTTFYRKVWTSVTGFQALARGYIQRQRHKKMLELRLLQPSSSFSSSRERKRPLDAFTAIIRIQAWVRTNIIRKAYVHELRLRASYTDAQWNKKKEDARNRILAVVPTSDGEVSDEDHDDVQEFQHSRPHSLRESTPHKSKSLGTDYSPMSMATAALTDLERTLEEAREARDLSGLSAPYVSTMPDYSYESGYMESGPSQLFHSESPDRSDSGLSSSSVTGGGSTSTGFPDDCDKGWTNPESLPKGWNPKHFDPYSASLSNKDERGSHQQLRKSEAHAHGPGKVGVNQGESGTTNAETSSLLAAARSSKLKQMNGKISRSIFGAATLTNDNTVAKEEQSIRSSDENARRKPIEGSGDATYTSAARNIRRPPSGTIRQHYDDPPLSMPMSFDDEDDLIIESDRNNNVQDVSALANDIPMHSGGPGRHRSTDGSGILCGDSAASSSFSGEPFDVRPGSGGIAYRAFGRDYVTDDDTDFFGGTPPVKSDALLEESF